MILIFLLRFKMSRSSSSRKSESTDRSWTFAVSQASVSNPIQSRKAKKGPTNLVNENVRNVVQVRIASP